MRALIGAVVLLLGAVSATAADKYESKEGKFKITFPSPPKASKQEMGGITMHTLIALDGTDKVHMVMFTLLPAQVKGVPADAVLDGAEKGAVANSGAKLVKSTKTKFGPDKFDARDLVLEKDGNKIRTLIVLAGNRIIVAIVGGPGEYGTGKDGTAFIDSLDIEK